MAFPSGGNNPLYGRDQGPPPPPGYGGAAVAGSLMPQTPLSWTYPTYPGAQYPSYPQGTVAPGMAYPYPNHFASAPTPYTRPPQPYPSIDRTMPANNMTNSTGGVGCEPGYNYFFPAEHTKIHVLKTGSTPPWQLPANFAIQFHASHVPTTVSLGELLKGFGATNPVAKKNRVTEVTRGGGGRWYKGLSFNGSSEGDMKKTLRDIGWDNSRTGLWGEKGVVYLYVQKD